MKTLPGASRADSHYIDGLVCRMKLAHKAMVTRPDPNPNPYPDPNPDPDPAQVTELDAPRILLLSCPLEHERRTFTSSLDALRQQEEEHMGMVVEEIARLQVNPISPYISLHLPIPPYISLHLPIPPYISLYLPMGMVVEEIARLQVNPTSPYICLYLPISPAPQQGQPGARRRLGLPDRQGELGVRVRGRGRARTLTLTRTRTRARARIRRCC